MIISYKHFGVVFIVLLGLTAFISLIFISLFVTNFKDDDKYTGKLEGREFSFVETPIIAHSSKAILAFDVLLLVSSVLSLGIFLIPKIKIPKKYIIVIIGILVPALGKIIASHVFVMNRNEANFYTVDLNVIDQLKLANITVPDELYAVKNAIWEEEASFFLTIIFALGAIFWAGKGAEAVESAGEEPLI